MRFDTNIVTIGLLVAEICHFMCSVGVNGGHLGFDPIKKMPPPKFDVIIQKW